MTEQGDDEMAQRKEQFLAAIEAVAEAYDADVYVYSGAIDDDGFGKLAAQVGSQKGTGRENCLLMLSTNGGAANAAYQIAKLLQSMYTSVIAFCPSRCKSAGTLVALGAHKLIMDRFGELGPLDVQVVKQNEIFARKSGLLAKSAFTALGDAAFELYERLMIGITLKSYGNVSFKLASELSAQMTATMMSSQYAQMNPDIIGGEHRDLEIAYEYGQRLIEKSCNASLESVYQLVYGYPAHDFIIDVDEAETLFNNVEAPTEELYQLVGLLSHLLYDQRSPSVVKALTRAAIMGINDDAATDTMPDGGEASEEPSMDNGGGADRGGDQQAANEDGPGADARRTEAARKDGKVA